MTEQWSVPAWALVATTLAVLLWGMLAATVLVVVGRSRRRAAAELDALREGAERLLARVEAVERRLAREQTPTDDREYVITHVGEDDHGGETPTVAAPLFADIVLRESVVQAASLAHGLRRALAPEARHRIRFAMRREVKRARKQRRANVRAARRAEPAA